MGFPLKTYRDQGFVILRDIFDGPTLQNVRRACETMVSALAHQWQQTGGLQDLHENEPFETRLIRLCENRPDQAPDTFFRDLDLKTFLPLFAHPRLLGAAQRILGPEIRLFPSYAVRAKRPAGPDTPVRWHQDISNRPETANALDLINVWTPLVPATQKNGCLHIIPGSHHQGVVSHGLFYLQIEEPYLTPLLHRAIPIEIDPGDVVLFSNLLFHCGPTNQTNKIRWSLDFRYQNASKPTGRSESGHLLKSQKNPSRVVRVDRHGHLTDSARPTRNGKGVTTNTSDG